MDKLDGKIVLVDDENFERDLLLTALKGIHIDADLIFFRNGPDALQYLRKTSDNIFLIISDVNMPGMNGLEFKRAIDNDESLKRKSVPFIFCSTAATRDQLEEAYEYRLQGYFLKPQDIKEMAKQLSLIISYWSMSSRPDDGLLTNKIFMSERTGIRDWKFPPL